MRAQITVLLAALLAYVATAQFAAHEVIPTELGIPRPEADPSTRARIRRRAERASRVAGDEVPEVDAEVKVTGGNYGIDISGSTCDGSDWVSSTQFPCFVGKGKNFAVIEAWQGGYGYTTYVSHCASEAHKAGMYVSLYAFMCPYCKGTSDGYTTAYNMVKKLASEGVSYTYIYVDVEDCSGCWSSSKSTNVAYVRSVVNGITAAGGKPAIYASAYEWSLVMGSDSSFSSLPLWYAHYDAKASMTDFTAFGGWSTPHMKQYNDHSDVSTCYSNVDVDYF